MARPAAERRTRVERWRDAAILTLILAGALGIPLVFRLDPVDLFRLPKTLFLRAEAILLAAVALAAALLGAPIPRPNWRDPRLLLPLAAYATTAVLTLTSTNRLLSMAALASATATLVVFLATVAAARAHGWILLAMPLAAALANALLVVVEEAKLWMPFGERGDIPHHLQCDALIGNPNEVGSYLAAAALACLAALSARAAEKRWAVRIGVIACVLLAGVIASQTLTAMVAFAAGALAMAASWKNAARAALAGAAAAAIVIALAAPIRARAVNVIGWLRHGEYNAVFTGRLTAFAAAWSMFAERPLIGVGPGAFAWQYYDHKIAAERRYPSLRLAYDRGNNFGQVHNDHLQVLAEGGVVGYGAFLALFGLLAALSFAMPAGAVDWRMRAARRLALPLAVFWLVLSVAQFPLETTVIRSLLVHLAALCVGWRSS